MDEPLCRGPFIKTSASAVPEAVVPHVDIEAACLPC